MLHANIKTNFGTIKVELDADKAPITVENFVQYARSGFYAGTLFHRVIDGFMIQGGGYGAGMVQKPTNLPIENEAKNMLLNEQYTIAMARASNPHSANSQFFINVKSNIFLNYPGQDGWGYCVFGKVIEGTEVVDAIKSVKTTRKGMFADVPVQDVVIESVEIIEAGVTKADAAEEHRVA